MAPPEQKHVLFVDGDADAPDVIKDSNGQVVLLLCRRCGAAEVELDESCRPATKERE